MGLNNLSASLVNITDSLPERLTVVSLPASLLSLTEIRDWLKLFLIATIFEVYQTVPFRAWDSIVSSVWATAHFEGKSDSYSEYLYIPVALAWTFDPRRGAARVSGADFTADCMMVWLSQHPAWVKAKNVTVATSSFGLKSNPRDRDERMKGPSSEVQFIVASDFTISFWHGWWYIKAEIFYDDIYLR